MEKLQFPQDHENSDELNIIEFEVGNFETNLYTTLNKFGYAVVEFEDNSNEAKADENIWRLQKYFGQGYASKNSRQDFIADITTNPKAYPDKVFRPVSDNGLQSPHTDGGYEKVPPDILFLYAFKKAEVGGENTVIQGEKLINDLDDESLKVLLRDDFYTLSRGPERTSTTPVFSIQNKSAYLCWGGHEYMKSDNLYLPIDHLEVFQETQKIISSPDNQTILDLKEGQVLIIDNRRALHGRKAFEDKKGDFRHSKRLWLNSNDSYRSGIVDNELVTRLANLKNSNQ